MTSTIAELYPQEGFLGLCVKLGTDAEVLKKYMIRHTKAQQIDGSTALTLPESTTTVQMIPMNAKEKELYDNARAVRCKGLGSLKQSNHGAKWNALNKHFYGLFASLVDHNSSKMKALESSIRALQSRDPNMRAVVFSSFREVCYRVEALVKRMGIPLFSFNGSTSGANRDSAIRSFQSTAQRGPAVFAITLATGSVGITLTAASHGTSVHCCCVSCMQWRRGSITHDCPFFATS